MVKRIITSVVALAVFVGILFLPPICFTVALAAVILFMLYECYSATKADVGMKTIGFISAVILMSSIYFCKAIEWDTFAWATASIGIIFIIALHMITVVAKHGKRNYKDILSNGFLTIYIVLSMSCVWLAKETFAAPLCPVSSPQDARNLSSLPISNHSAPRSVVHILPMITTNPVSVQITIVSRKTPMA